MNKKLLLHSCCAPCTSGVLPQLEGYDITLLFYNPNIDTEDEFNLRAKTLEDYVSKYNNEFGLNIEYIIVPYNHSDFLSGAKALKDQPEGGKRCCFCISQRLDFTAKYAMENGYDIFASTLSVSPHKNHNFINDTGIMYSKKYRIDYLSSDFKKNNGFLHSIQNSKKYNLYRQNYCGCEFAKTHLK